MTVLVGPPHADDEPYRREFSYLTLIDARGARHSLLFSLTDLAAIAGKIAETVRQERARARRQPMNHAATGKRA